MAWSHVAGFSALVKKADKWMALKDQAVETMFLTCLCQCNLVPMLGVSDTVLSVVAMGYECPATYHQEGLNPMV